MDLYGQDSVEMDYLAERHEAGGLAGEEGEIQDLKSK